MKNIKDIYARQILKEELSVPSYENIGDSLYSFLEKLRSKYPQEKETIGHWLLIINENIEEIDNIATADMNPKLAYKTVSDALDGLRELIKNDRY